MVPSLRLFRVPNIPRLFPTLRRSVSLVKASDHWPLIRVLRVGVFVLFMASSLRKVTLKSSSCSSVTSPLRPESKLSAFLMTSALSAAISALRCIILASGEVSVWTVFNAEAANAARKLLLFSAPDAAGVFSFSFSLSCFSSFHATELSSLLIGSFHAAFTSDSVFSSFTTDFFSAFVFLKLAEADL